jgi:hypothetical protein
VTRDQEWSASITLTIRQSRAHIEGEDARASVGMA